MYCPASKLHNPPFPVVYSPATCAWCLILGECIHEISLDNLGDFSIVQFPVAEWTHDCGVIISIDFKSVLDEYIMEEVLLHTLLRMNQIVHERKKVALFLMWCRKYSQLSLDVWNAGTAKQNNKIGLCLFLSSMADSKLAYTTIGAGISYRRFVNRRRVSSLDNSYWSWPTINAMCLYFIVLDSSLWSKEVTEPTLRVSCEMIILCIILTKDAMFEFVQILEHKCQ